MSLSEDDKVIESIKASLAVEAQSNRLFGIGTGPTVVGSLLVLLAQYLWPLAIKCYNDWNTIPAEHAAAALAAAADAAKATKVAAKAEWEGE